jgi:hypothetical protein
LPAARVGKLWLGRDDGTCTRTMTETGAAEIVDEAVTIKMGIAATQAVPRATDLQTFLIAAANTAGGAAVEGDGGATAFSSFAGTLAGLVAAVGSTKLKAE